MKNTMNKDKSYLTWNEIRNSDWELVRYDIESDHELDYPNHLYDMNGRMLEVGQNIIRTTTGRHSGLKIASFITSTHFYNNYFIIILLAA